MDGEEGRDSDGRGSSRRAAPANLRTTTFMKVICFRIHGLVGKAGGTLLRTDAKMVRLTLEAAVYGWVRAEEEQIALALNFACD